MELGYRRHGQVAPACRPRDADSDDRILRDLHRPKLRVSGTEQRLRILMFRPVDQDFGSPVQWWRNRLLRIFLVFLLTTFGALAGNYIGLAEMFSTLF